MHAIAHFSSRSCRGASAPSRRGFSSLDVMAALAVLLVILGSTVPLFVRHLRLLADSRQERMALGELANQVERLASLPVGERAAFLAAPPLSPLAVARLPGAALVAEGDAAGGRVVLRLSWQSVGRATHPLAVAVWLPAAAATAEEAP